MKNIRTFATIALIASVSAGSFAAVAGASTKASSTKAKQPRSSQPIFVATRGGGFVPFGFDQRALSDHIITADGRHYQPGVITLEYPGPALYPVFVSQLSKSELAAFDKRAKKAGLNRKSVDYGLPNTADVPALVTTYRGTQQIMLSWGVGEEGLSNAQRANRAAVKSVLAPLEKLNGKQVVPTAIVLTAQAATTDQLAVDGPVPTIIDWPVTAKPLASVGLCSVLSGSEGKAAALLLTKQNALTQYRSDGKVFNVFARISVPGDRGCGQQR